MKTADRKPFDYFPAMEKLRRSGHELTPDERDMLKASVALNASDIEAVSLYVDLDGNDWADIYPPVQKSAPITTGQAIDTFLNTYGKTSPREEELLERLIFNPVPDYSSVLESEEKNQAPDNGNDNLARIVKEINTAPNKVSADTAPKTKKTPDDNSPQQPSLSFELAKIFVKQGHFERAHDIISKIHLNNPEKNVYFADQLRFLEKLIKIKQSKI